jgi:hypothetical protein
MKHVIKVVFQMFLLACPLTLTATLATAQDASGKQPAADNTKVNQRDKNKADLRPINRKRIDLIARSPDRFAGLLCRISPYPVMRITSRSSRRTVWSR